MKLHGQQIIGNSTQALGNNNFTAINPVSGQALPFHFTEAMEDEINSACLLSAAAFMEYRKKTGIEKAFFLETVAKEIEALGNELIERCTAETGLPAARIIGERARTTGQLLLFAQLLREGSWVHASIDTAQPERQPLPKADIRSMQMAIGPVAVFGASNFPLAFSVAGGDTVSALAAGCPVIVKAHPAHPGTCELIATAIIKAAEKTNMPEGVFSMLHGGADTGLGLLKHQMIKAVGFTGSFTVGKKLFDVANQRKEPIPVFAEMSSINPVFILPEIIAENGDSIAQGITNSINLGVGQFCTNPGLIVIEKNAQMDSFIEKLIKSFEASSGGAMLTKNIKEAYDTGVSTTQGIEGITHLVSGAKAESFTGVQPQMFKTSADKILDGAYLPEEIFGPASILVEANDGEAFIKIAASLHGHLTASVWGTPNDLENNKHLIEILTLKAGRLIINGYPTGVEVCYSMVHGGPYPATTAPASTSVGTDAIYRFTRPVCFQGFSDALLPEALQENNPLKITRKINGKYYCN